MQLTYGNLGARARLKREQAGLTREQLASRAEVSTSTIARLELNDRLPATATMLRIAAALSVSLDDLVGKVAP